MLSIVSLIIMGMLSLMGCCLKATLRRPSRIAKNYFNNILLNIQCLVCLLDKWLIIIKIIAAATNAEAGPMNINRLIEMRAIHEQ